MEEGQNKQMKRIIFFVVVGITLLVINQQSFAGCNDGVSYRNSDYCGPEANRILSNVIADELFGPFKTACLDHDACYERRAMDIAMRMLGENDPFTSYTNDIAAAKSDCDNEFYQNLISSCEYYKSSGKCKQNASLYYNAVKRYGNSAFNSAIQEAKKCMVLKK